MTTYENNVFLAIVFLIIIITWILSWKEKNEARRFVLGSRSNLQDLVSQAWDLLNANFEISDSFLSDIQEISHDYTNLFYGVNENSFDICWCTKQKKVIALENLVTAKIDEIKQELHQAKTFTT